MVRPFVSEYLAGRTPIPCSLCNNHLKFDQLLVRARQIGADRIATGHYARNEYDPVRNRWILKRPADLTQGPDLLPLWTDAGAAFADALSAGQLPEAAGARDCRSSMDWRWRRSPIRRRSASFPAATTSGSSTRIWTSRARRFRTRPANSSPRGRGDRAHSGIHNFTVGQRKGLGVSSPIPLYVLQIDRRVTA